MKINLHRASSTLLARTPSFNIPSQHPRDSIVLKILTAVITAETIKIQTKRSRFSTVTYIILHRVRTRWSISHRQSSVRPSLSACIAAGIKCLGHATAGDRSPGHPIRVPRVFSRSVSRICTTLSGHFSREPRASVTHLLGGSRFHQPTSSSFFSRTRPRDRLHVGRTLSVKVRRGVITLKLSVTDIFLSFRRRCVTTLLLGIAYSFTLRNRAL